MEALGLNFVDWTIIVVITASVVLSITRGFVKEFLSLFIWVIAFFAAVNFEFLATPKINEFIGNPDISKIISDLNDFTYKMTNYFGKYDYSYKEIENIRNEYFDKFSDSILVNYSSIGNVFKLYELDLISDSSNLFKEIFINDNSFLEINS